MTFRVLLYTDPEITSLKKVWRLCLSI